MVARPVIRMTTDAIGDSLVIKGRATPAGGGMAVGALGRGVFRRSDVYMATDAVSLSLVVKIRATPVRGTVAG